MRRGSGRPLQADVTGLAASPLTDGLAALLEAVIAQAIAEARSTKPDVAGPARAWLGSAGCLACLELLVCEDPATFTQALLARVAGPAIGVGGGRGG